MKCISSTKRHRIKLNSARVPDSESNTNESNPKVTRYFLEDSEALDFI